MEQKTIEPTMVQRDQIVAKKPWQTPLITCETEATSAQKFGSPAEMFGSIGPSGT